MGSSAVVREAGRAFPHDFRQTAKAVPLLCQVPHIDASSVSVAFAARGVDIWFRARADDDGTRDDEEEMTYSMGFDVAGEIDAEACTFNVATKNMVVILAKKVEGLWPDAGGPLLIPRPYSHGATTATRVEGTDATAGSASTNDKAKAEVGTTSTPTGAGVGGGAVPAASEAPSEAQPVSMEHWQLHGDHLFELD